MKAMVLVRPGFEQPMALQERPMPEPGPGEAVVRLHAAALNHRDHFQIRGVRGAEWAPYIPGSDGAGEVAAVGAGVTAWKPGDSVVINAALYCGQCAYCLNGEQSLCDRFGILGGPSDGTFAEYVRVPARNLAAKPAHLDYAAAAALPLALGTAWRAMVTQAALRPGETVLIHGIGSGVALYCLQIAQAMGARVIVTSSSPAKLDRARAMGAAAGILYRDEPVAERTLELTGGQGADLVVDSGGTQTMPISLAAVRKGGRIVNFGGTTGNQVTFNCRDLFWKQVSLLGTTMNSQADFDAAMRFVANTRLVPTVSATFPLDQAEAALKDMENVAQFGKLVLNIG
ncbi:MAG TPA: zinc-binding dehydrogenase [Symbiobacteriaceae bacterium]|jgi:NADPH:quinone reductase-like Zn-dependent oxidoreductase